MSSPIKVLAATFCVLLVSCGSEDAPVREASPQVTAATPQSAGSDGESENAGLAAQGAIPGSAAGFRASARKPSPEPAFARKSIARCGEPVNVGLAAQGAIPMCCVFCVGV